MEYETPELPTPQPNAPQTVKPPKRSPSFFYISLLVVMLSAGVFAGAQVYAARLIAQNRTLDASRAKYANQLSSFYSQRSVTAAYDIKDPAGHVELLGGKVQLSLPKDWQRVPAAGCSIGSIDATAVCLDVANVSPSSLVTKASATPWNVSISVFKNQPTGSTARNWYETKYYASQLAGAGTPAAENIAETLISGHSALSFNWVRQTGSVLDSQEVTDVVTSTSYAVVIRAQVVASTAYTTSAFDYRTTYLPFITQLVQSLTIQEK